MTVHDDRRVIMKALSMLLQYPDAPARDELGECTAVVRQLPESRPKTVLASALERMARLPLLRLQEQYCATFDLDRSNSLALTYHRYGDGKERGGALAELNRIYREAGYQVTAAELPDHLPLVLEFLSVCSENDCERIVTQYAGAIGALARHLHQAQSPYAGMLEILSDMFSHAAGKEER